MRKGISIAAACAVLLSGSYLWGQADWASYGQDQGASRFSKLTQINAGNVTKLEKAWTFHTGSDGPNEVTPVVVNSVM